MLCVLWFHNVYLLIMWFQQDGATSYVGREFPVVRPRKRNAVNVSLILRGSK